MRRRERAESRHHGDVEASGHQIAGARCQGERDVARAHRYREVRQLHDGNQLDRRASRALWAPLVIFVIASPTRWHSSFSFWDPSRRPQWASCSSPCSAADPACAHCSDTCSMPDLCRRVAAVPRGDIPRSHPRPLAFHPSPSRRRGPCFGAQRQPSGLGAFFAVATSESIVSGMSADLEPDIPRLLLASATRG
jgi:hypothetical protein